jgi:hypothetical protein
MLQLLAGVVLAAAPQGGQVKLALPGFTSPALSPAAMTYYSEYFGQQLTLEGIRVVTSSEIGQILGLSRQQALLGCSENSCSAELTDALGVDGLVLGSLGKFGSEYQVDIKVLSPVSGSVMGLYSHRVAGETDLLDDYTAAARKLAAVLRKVLKKDTTAVGRVDTATSREVRPYAWIPAVAGVVLAAGGTYALVEAIGHHNALVQGQPVANPTAYGQEGAAYQTAGWALMIAGAAGLAAAGGMYAFGGPPEARATIALIPGGAGVSVTGVFP